MLVLVGAATGCRGGDSIAEQRAGLARANGDIVLAAAWPWQASGDLGLRFGQGLDLAATEINSAGGVLGRRLVIHRFDDHGTIDDGRLVAQRIASDPSVVAVIGHLQSHISLSAAAIYDEAGLVMFAPTTTDPELTERGYTRVFRGTFTHTTVGRQMAAYAAGRGYRRVSVFYVRDAYGRGLANAFESEAGRLSLEIVDRQAYDASDSVNARTFQTALQASQALGIDAIFLAGEVPAAGEFIAVARRMGIEVPIIGGDGLSSESLFRTAGSAAEGAVVASMFHADEPRAEVQHFSEDFQRRYGIAPDAAAALGTDAVRVLADAIVRAGSPDPAAIARALHGGAGFQGVTARFKFDSTGNLIQRDIVPLIVKHGQFAYLTPERIALERATLPAGKNP
jgi:branched-chain amino acid transport system substrate-binding protein